MHVVHNPVDLARSPRPSQEPIEAATSRPSWTPPVIVAAGRLAEAKNYPLLIEALAMLRQRLPASLFILGQGDQEPALRA